MDSQTVERLRELVGQGLNWEYLISAAHRNQVAPLLYWNLNNTCADSVPMPFMDELRHYFHINARHNLLQTRELLRILGQFKANGVACIPFKGPVLASSVYGQLSLRQFTDLDLLIDKGDIATATDLLLSQGYRPNKTLEHNHAAPDHGAEPVCVFERHDGMVSVDLHWGLERTFMPFSMDLASLKGRLTKVAIADKTVYGPPPEELLLILCAHGSRHLWNRMKWICDVAELLRIHQVMDWELINEQARNLGSERMLHVGLFLANDLLGAPVPDTLLHRIRTDPGVKSLSSQVYERLFVDDDTPSGVIGTFVFRTRVRERWREKVAGLPYLVHRTLAPTANDISLIRLPAPLAFIYYMIRPIRLVGMYGFGLMSKTPWLRKSR